MNAFRFTEDIIIVEDTTVYLDGTNIRSIGKGGFLGRAKMKAVMALLDKENKNLCILASREVRNLLFELGIKTEDNE